MGTFINLHVQSDDRNEIGKILQALSGVKNVSAGPYPKNFRDKILLDANSDPDFMIIKNAVDGWTTIELNSFKKLHSWIQGLSAELNTTVIHVIAQTTSDVYYFLMHEKGLFRREIEVYAGDRENVTDRGIKFSFERSELVSSGDDEYYFDIDTLNLYCNNFGFDLYEENNEGPYLVLMNSSTGKTIKEHVADYLNPKPWWKFW